MSSPIFKDFDFAKFWNDSDHAQDAYISAPPSDQLIKSIEEELGYTLPASYIELMKMHNGGTPVNQCFPTNERTSWSENHVAITGILGIGREKNYSLGGGLGSKCVIDEGGYPDIGVYICDCPSAGHDIIMLDYSKCGRHGEPEVVHVDQESDYKKTFLAKDFETFIRGLVNDDVYDTSAEDLVKALENLKTGNFSDELQHLMSQQKSVDFDKVLRNLLTELAKNKGYFALHEDALSHLAYDIQFYLLTSNKKIKSKKEYFKAYPSMLALANNEISLGGYAEDFVTDWFDERIRNKEILNPLFGALSFTDEFKKVLIRKIQPYLKQLD
jgi:hypothetical protein